MKQEINRRDLFKLGIASAAVLATGKAIGSSALAGTVDFVEGGKDFSPWLPPISPKSKKAP